MSVEYPGKSIVICLDGTSNNFDTVRPTNVLTIFDQLYKNDASKQIAYYQPGIGNNLSFADQDAWEVSANIDSLRDAAFGSSLSLHVLTAYEYLVNNYSPGDRIYLFGFSRGSYTVRVLAGLIEACGILRDGLKELISTSWKLYTSWKNHQNDPQRLEKIAQVQEKFQEMFSYPYTNIFFMGLFDTVNSVGILRDKTFPYTASGNNVEYIRHAISIDERRVRYGVSPFIPREHLFNRSPNRREDLNFKEVWFSGCHADIGGSSLPVANPDGSRADLLSDIPLAWVVNELCSIEPDAKSSKRLLFKGPGNSWPRTDTLRVATTARVVDQLSLSAGLRSVFWMTLELLLLHYKATVPSIVNKDGVETYSDQNVMKFGPHLGRRREAPSFAKLHSTVQMRYPQLESVPGNIKKAYMKGNFVGRHNEIENCYDTLQKRFDTWSKAQ